MSQGTREVEVTELDEERGAVWGVLNGVGVTSEAMDDGEGGEFRVEAGGGVVADRGIVLGGPMLFPAAYSPCTPAAVDLRHRPRVIRLVIGWKVH